MGFFDGVIECNEKNGGGHPFDSPTAHVRLDGGTDYAVRCGGDCGVTAWGQSPGEAMSNAQDVDRANRKGHIW
ncbi:MAG TPA: hypothetical protein VEQ15_00415 [Myxococcales bacterium]|nr:hypothetical protein [Myxococcales bacterium]